MQETLLRGHVMRGQAGADVDVGDTAYERGQTRSQMEHRDKAQQKRRQLEKDWADSSVHAQRAWLNQLAHEGGLPLPTE